MLDPLHEWADSYMAESDIPSGMAAIMARALVSEFVSQSNADWIERRESDRRLSALGLTDKEIDEVRHRYIL